MPGTFYFGHLLYEDDTAYPRKIETGLLRGGRLLVQAVPQSVSPADNRPDTGPSEIRAGWPRAG